MIDGDLLARVDACALTLGQTRRVFTERALEAWLKDSEGDPAEVMERRILAARAPSAAPYANADEAAAAGYKRRGSPSPSLERFAKPRPKGGKR